MRSNSGPDIFNDTGESADGCSGRHVWDLQNTRIETGSQFTDPNNPPISLKITVSPPYFKEPELPKNNLGLPIKPYYTTQDVCKVLGLSQDIFRQRIYKCFYPKTDKVGGKRIFTIGSNKVTHPDY
jgi:hypothetical protein